MKHIALTICAVAQCLCMTGCGTGVKAILYSRGEPAPFRASGTDVMLIYKAVTPVSSSDEFNGLMKFIGIITFPLNVLELPFAVCLDVVTLPVDGIIAINNAIVENREKKTQSENTPEYGPRIANTDATADEFSVILDIVGDGEDAALWFAIVNRTNSDNTQFYEPLVNDSELYLD